MQKVMDTLVDQSQEILRLREINRELITALEEVIDAADTARNGSQMDWDVLMIAEATLASAKAKIA